MSADAVMEESAPSVSEDVGQQPDKGPPLTKGERDNMQRNILKLLTEEQLNRYEAFRRSSLARRNMKRLQQTIVGQQVNLNMTIVMCGIAKVFVGELVEAARELAEQRGEQGPLQVYHIQEAYQRLDRDGRIPHRTPHRQLALR